MTKRIKMIKRFFIVFASIIVMLIIGDEIVQLIPNLKDSNILWPAKAFIGFLVGVAFTCALYIIAIFTRLLYRYVVYGETDIF